MSHRRATSICVWCTGYGLKTYLDATVPSCCPEPQHTQAIALEVNAFVLLDSVADDARRMFQTHA
eukprot:963994-Rhodomonas_salina.3